MPYVRERRRNGRRVRAHYRRGRSSSMIFWIILFVALLAAATQGT